MPGFSMRPAVIGLALVVMLAAPATAAPAPAAVADRLVAALAAESEATATYEDATGDGASITISGLRITQPDVEDRAVTIPELVLFGVSDRADGAFAAERATFDGGEIIDGGRRIAWATGTAADVLLPPPADAGASVKTRPFGSLEMTDIRILRGGAETPAVTVVRISASLGDVVEGDASAFAVDAIGVAATVDELVPGRRAALLETLGYETLSMDVAFAGAIDFYADILRLDPLVVAVADLGEIRVACQLGGVSIGGFVAGSRREEATDEATIESFSVRFENRGVVERALERQAAAMGVERTVFVENFLSAVPFMLNFIGNPPFQAELAAAAGIFLRDPHSITFAANPETPVSLGEILAAAVTNRSALPDLLAIEVTAND